MSDTVVIRKYENRRLYDTSASRYINLEDIARMVREGTDVRVVDAKTGEDITRSILAQIIVEDARSRDSEVPLDFLKEIIVASGRAMSVPLDFMTRLLPQTGGDSEIAELRRRIEELENKVQQPKRKPRPRR